MGCGAGWTSIFYAKRGYDVLGQDISEDMIDLARENQARQNVGDNLSFIGADYETIDLDGQFDAVVFLIACTMPRMKEPRYKVPIGL